MLQKIVIQLKIISMNPRPSSSKPVSTIPIVIDETEIDSDGGRVEGSSKGKLNQIIPEFPAFSMKSNSTSLLYSKFIMKDLKKDKIPRVKRAFKKKQQVTESQTNLVQQSNHSRRETSHKQFYCTDKMSDFNEEKILDFQFNNFFKSRSAANIKKQSTIDTQQTRTLIKNRTQSNLKRPQTAVKKSNQQITSAKRRPTSGYNRSNEKAFYDERQMTGCFDNILKISQIIDCKIKPVDHVKKNVRQVSAYSKKSNSIYLTGATISEFKGGRMKQTKENLQNREYAKFLENRKKSELRGEQKKKIEKKNKYYDDYYKEKMPGEYIKVFSKDDKNKEVENSLVSIGFETTEKQEERIVEELKIDYYFHDLAKNCETIQLQMKKRVRTQTHEDHLVNIWDCQKLISLGKMLIQYENHELEKKNIRSQIYSIVKVLPYFKNKTIEQNIKLLSLPFSIEVVEEGQLILDSSNFDHLYIILNGSVTKSLVEIDDLYFEEDKQSGTMSLFDGEIFAQPLNPSQKSHKLKITALEQSILMKIPHQSYKQSFMTGSQVEEALEILKLLFRTQLLNKLIKIEDLQTLCLFLQFEQIKAKSLVFRKEQIYEKLIIVGRGQLAIINESVIKRKKEVEKDVKFQQKMKKIEWREQSIPHLHEMRKQNLIDYELLKQTHEDIYYYHFSPLKQFIQGDSLNWRVIKQAYEAEEAGQSKKEKKQAPPLMFSLMSLCNETKVFTLSMKAFKSLPSQLKKVLHMKSELKAKEEERVHQDKTKEMKDWENYKRKFCQGIIKSKRHI